MTFKEFLTNECGYRHVRLLPDGKRFAAIMPLMFTSAIVTVRAGDTHSTEDRWCYHTEGSALAALDAWDGTGEPDGWHRHPGSGRRRGDDAPPGLPTGTREWVAR